jgi:hypothetical protein
VSSGQFSQVFFYSLDTSAHPLTINSLLRLTSAEAIWPEDSPEKIAALSSNQHYKGKKSSKMVLFSC